jgi:hypothetical protein
MLSRMLPIALDGTLTACLPTVRSQASSEGGLKMLSNILLSTLSNTLPIALEDTPCLLDYTLPSKLSRRSQVHSEYTPKYTSKYVLKSMLSKTLPIALNGTLPACLTVRSQVSSQDHPKYTPSTLPSTPLSTLSSSLLSLLSGMLLIALDGTPPAYLTLRSQIHSQEGRESQSHLTICSHVCLGMLNAEICRVADARYREA